MATFLFWRCLNVRNFVRFVRDGEKCRCCCAQILNAAPLSLASRRSFSSKKLFEKKPAPKRPKNKSKLPEIKAWQGISLGELSQVMGIPLKGVYECLQATGFSDAYDSRPNESIYNAEHISLLVAAAGFKLQFVAQPKKSGAQAFFDACRQEVDMNVRRRPPPDDDPSRLAPRPPVVTIMGHVDHGKTTLLDFLRKSQIVKSEFGGITQHIGAFSVKLHESKDVITFLDTPGHAAFKSMRARGARVTDIVILVVAADDGVMDQTVESIKFAKEAGVSVIVAINKCDKGNVDIDRIKRQLLTYDLVPEDYGGDVQVVKISALKGTGIEQLKEAILTQAEIMQLKAEKDGLVEAVVIESKTSHGKGKVATLLVQRGTLTKGRHLLAGNAHCCVRAMFDEFGKSVSSAEPSTPIEVTGWRNELPSAGEDVLEVENEKRARDVLNYRKLKQMEQKKEEEIEAAAEIRQKERELYSQIRLENIEAEIKNIRIRKKKKKLAIKSFAQELRKSESATDEESKPEFDVILKGDVHGSLEAIMEVFATYNSEKCDFDIIHTGVGPVTENDIELAETFGAVIYTFNVQTPSTILPRLKTSPVKLKTFNIIYRLVDDVKEELSKKLPEIDRMEVLGEGVVLKVFKIPGKSGSSKRIPVAGCRCTKGNIIRKARAKIMRLGQEIFDGEIESMQKGPESVATSFVEDEVGLLFSDLPANLKILPDDTILCYKLVKEPQVIDWNPPGF